MYSVVHWRRLLKKAKPKKTRQRKGRNKRTFSRSVLRPFCEISSGKAEIGARKKSRNRGKVFTATPAIGARSGNANDPNYIHIAWNQFNYWNAVACKRSLGENARKAIISIWLEFAVRPGMTAITNSRWEVVRGKSLVLGWTFLPWLISLTRKSPSISQKPVKISLRNQKSFIKHKTLSLLGEQAGERQ